MLAADIVASVPVLEAVRLRTEAIDPRLAADRTWCAENSTIPWLEEHIELDGKRVLEYGAGEGLVSRAFAAKAAHVHGLDIDSGAIEKGASALRSDGIENVTLEAQPVQEIVPAMRGFAGKVDIVLLYAVLEHLTVTERLEVLEASRELAGADGLIVCIETPNRLISFDVHSGMLPYLHWLPDDLAALYGSRSQRADFVEGLASARGSGIELEWWTRFGRTASFHEFELVFGEIDRHIVAGGYDSVMWPARPLHPMELPLASDLARQRPDLGPVWSRAWLDLVFCAQPIPEPPRLMRPWLMDTRDSTEVDYTIGNSLVLSSPSSRLRVRPDSPTRRVIVGFMTSPGEAVLDARAGDWDGDHASILTHVDAPERVRYVELTWDDPSEYFELSLSVPGYVVLVAHEA